MNPRTHLGPSIPSLNLLRMQTQQKSPEKDTVRVKKEERFDEDFILEDSSSSFEVDSDIDIDLPSEDEKPKEVNFNSTKTHNLVRSVASTKDDSPQKPKVKPKSNIPQPTKSKNKQEQTKKKIESDLVQKEAKPSARRQTADTRPIYERIPAPDAAKRKAVEKAKIPSYINKNKRPVTAEEKIQEQKVKPTETKPVKNTPKTNIPRVAQINEKGTPVSARPVTFAEQPKPKATKPKSDLTKLNLDKAKPTPDRVQTARTKPEKPKATPTTQTKRETPMTARNGRVRTVQEDIDPVAASKKLRAEIEKEFGQSVTEDDLKMEWLDNMDEDVRRMSLNIQSDALYDNSILSIYQDSTADITPNDGETPYDTVKRMLDVGFDAIHQQNMAEKDLLTERISLLDKLHEELMKDHANDFNAHLTRDDDPKFDFGTKKTIKAVPHTSRR